MIYDVINYLNVKFTSQCLEKPSGFQQINVTLSKHNSPNILTPNLQKNQHEFKGIHYQQGNYINEVIYMQR